MKERKPLRSEMGFSTPDKITVRGYDLPNQLLGKIDLGGMAFLEITGRMPNSREAEVFNALLVTLVEHGMTPQAIASRLISICFSNAVISGRRPLATLPEPASFAWPQRAAFASNRSYRRVPASCKPQKCRTVDLFVDCSC